MATYHVCASLQINEGEETTYYDGIFFTERLIERNEDYRSLRGKISEVLETKYSNFVILSLSLVSEGGHP